MKSFEEMHSIIRYLVYFFIAGTISISITFSPEGSFYNELKNSSWGFFHMVSTLTMAMSLVDMTRGKFVNNIKTDSDNDESLGVVVSVSLFLGVIIYMFTFGLITFLVNL